MNRTTRVPRRHLLILGAGTLLATGCSAAAPATATLPAGAVGAAPGTPGTWTPILPASDLAVGENRFLYAVLDDRNRPITNARVHLRFFDLAKSDQTAVSEADALFRGQGLGDKGVYVARATFDAAGAWGVEAAVTPPGGELRILRTKFEVRAQSLTPAIGAAAPRTQQKLMAGASDPHLICTAVPRCELHDLTIADAIAAGRPALVLFATPGFCSSAVCAPGLEAVQAVEPDFRDHVSFLHLEIYDDPATRTPTAAVLEWKLPTEPWVFLVAADGTIADKLEGGITSDELREALQRLA